MAVFESEMMTMGVGRCLSARAIAASSAVARLQVRIVRDMRGGELGLNIAATAYVS